MSPDAIDEKRKNIILWYVNRVDQIERKIELNSRIYPWKIHQLNMNLKGSVRPVLTARVKLFIFQNSQNSDYELILHLYYTLCTLAF
jgi:hypothetical protein